MGKGIKMDGLKESAAVSAGLTAPAWLPALNEWGGCLIGLATLAYAVGRVYFLFKNKGKE